MSNHIFFDGVDISSIEVADSYRKWIADWLSTTEKKIDDGEVSSSMCLEGTALELALNKKVVTDWEGILAKYLTDNKGLPIAYSETYGKKLYRFNAWHQSPVHAVYTRWWIDNLINGEKVDNDFYADLIEKYIQPNGWIYNADVSATVLQHRMKSEYMMSMAMGIDILTSAGCIEKQKEQIQATLSHTHITDYLSAEYFRAVALNKIDSTDLIPKNIPEVIRSCESEIGYCDFSLTSKVDAYMGTAKRTSRDQELHSSISCTQALYLATTVENGDAENIRKILQKYSSHIKDKPMDIPPFKMRDIESPFGLGISPLEILASSYLVKIF